MNKDRAALIERLLAKESDNPEVVRGIFDLARVENDVPTGRKARDLAIRKVAKTTGAVQKAYLEAYWDILLWLAQHGDLDSALLYLEKNRPADKRFYQNRRKVLKQVVDAMQGLLDDELDELFISMPPRVGKTTIVSFVTAIILGLEPESTNLYCSCNDGIAETYYRGVLAIINDDATYAWHEIFPNVRLAATNAKEHTVDMNRQKNYPTLRCVSIDMEINGKADCTRFLIGDDLCSGIIEARSPSRLAKKWDVVQNNLIPRQVGKKGKNIWIGTRWALADPLGKERELLETDPAFASKRWKAVEIPALDANGESNFDYPNGSGMTTEQFLQRRAAFEKDGDEASWLAQYMATPIERAGQVFDPTTMKFYNGVLPDGEPDRVFSFVDTAFGGGDFLSAPVAYQYGEDIYIHDVVFDKSDKFITIPEVVKLFADNNVGSACFEGTKTTADYKDAVDKKLREKDIRVNITMKAASTRMRKEDRIFDKAPEIREFYFRDTSNRSPQYSAFMRNLHAFSAEGQNLHDDAPDSLAGLACMVRGRAQKATVFTRPF